MVDCVEPSYLPGMQYFSHPSTSAHSVLSGHGHGGAIAFGDDNKGMYCSLLALLPKHSYGNRTMKPGGSHVTS